MHRLHRSLLALALAVALQHPALAVEEPRDEPQTCSALTGAEICISQARYTADVCTAIAAYATHWQLPEAFLARLIWQESQFDPVALSPAGAQGIAQFMPGTARLRALRNPFDPAEALAKSAEYLRFLDDKFGNLGLAAAAYNGGERRIETYVAKGGGRLPSETRNYVSIITGRSVDNWLVEQPEEVDFALHPEADFQTACVDMAHAVGVPNLTTSPASWQPWGVLISQNPSADLARARFERVQGQFDAVLGSEQLMLISVRNPNFGNRLRFSAMVGRPTRAAAQDVCRQLTAAGGTCLVQKVKR